MGSPHRGHPLNLTSAEVEPNGNTPQVGVGPSGGSDGPGDGEDNGEAGAVGGLIRGFHRDEEAAPSGDCF